MEQNRRICFGYTQSAPRIVPTIADELSNIQQKGNSKSRDEYYVRTYTLLRAGE